MTIDFEDLAEGLHGAGIYSGTEMLSRAMRRAAQLSGSRYWTVMAGALDAAADAYDEGSGKNAISMRKAHRSRPTG